ncbi:MAG: uroporphyrinogen-III C-methyltransferase [Acetobacter sp.]|nr:uroporphyrinogen-III C-methyltransferase [Acetobacter sp.]
MTTPPNTTLWFPIMLRVGEDPALVIGGGKIAASKIHLLHTVGIRVHVVAPTLCSSLHHLVQKKDITHQTTHIQPETFLSLLNAQHYRLVYLATDDHSLNATLAALCKEQGILACAVDNPKASHFITPALVHRGLVQIAISTGGAAPVLACYIRSLIERIIPHGISALAQFMSTQKKRLHILFPDPKQRRHIWEQFLEGIGGPMACQGHYTQAQQVLETLITSSPHKPTGEVWLVGAGPGDPDLLTLAALRLMQNADVVLYDHLVTPDILNLVRRDAKRIPVGKTYQQHTLSQEEINAELIRYAQAGQRVLRLKGGDPFIFGRGGEELQALTDCHIPVRVIPGISAANGCAAYAGIPLTHRDCAQSCLFITGHTKADGSLTLEWSAIALRHQTIVIYMGLSILPSLCTQLITHGLPPDWPAAIIEQGTTPAQRVITGTLTSLPELVRQHDFITPSLLIVGKVVQHRVPPVLA